MDLAVFVVVSCYVGWLLNIQSFQSFPIAFKICKEESSKLLGVICNDCWCYQADCWVLSG